MTFNRRYWSVAPSLWLAACLVLFAVVLWWTLATVRTQRAGERVRSIEVALDEQLDRGEISAEQHEWLL
ncbi:MAG TPA: hypothetical protein VFW26_08670, partial [Gaiellales bacterium]|nr:hypothetical protein [Gaiellales bacterium]